MTNPSKNDDENSGAKRASDFSEAMLVLPGYADDSMFFVIRYVSRVKDALCESDFNEFMATLGAMDQVSQGDAGGPESCTMRYEKAQEIKQKAIDMIKDYPDLVRDFDLFSTNARAAEQATKGHWPKAQ